MVGAVCPKPLAKTTSPDELPCSCSPTYTGDYTPSIQQCRVGANPASHANQIPEVPDACTECPTGG